MVKEAEAHDAEDKKRGALVEAKNQADAVIHSTEKSLKEHGDKVGEEDKQCDRDRTRRPKAAVEGGDAEVIAAKTQT